MVFMYLRHNLLFMTTTFIVSPTRTYTSISVPCATTSFLSKKPYYTLLQHAHRPFNFKAPFSPALHFNMKQSDELSSGSGSHDVETHHDTTKRKRTRPQSPPESPLSPLFSDEDYDESGDVSDSSILPGSFSRVRLVPPISSTTMAHSTKKEKQSRKHVASKTPEKRPRRYSPSPSLSPPPQSHSSSSSSSSSFSSIEDIEDEPTQAQVTTKDLLHALDLMTKHFDWAPPKAPKTKTVLDSLVRTILSQATTDVNSGAAFRNLKSRYPSWDSYMNDSFQNTQETIRVAGLSESKTKTIRNVLETVRDERNGKVCMEYVKDIKDVEEVRKELTRFKGVGEKTAACVILFGMNRVAFPVDTHVRRVVERLGWMGQHPPSTKKKQFSPDDVWDKMKYLVPNDWGVALGLHVLLIQVGKRVCKSGKVKPKCNDCPLKSVCASSTSKDS